MTITTFIGIDLAWQSDKNHTGIVVARGDDSGAIADVASEGIASLEAIVAFVQEHATANTVIAIDAPLVIRNATGQRPCETEISRRFGARHADAHSTNLGKYPDAPPCRLIEMLESAGFSHEPRPHTSGVRDGRWAFEVYPHPALVNLFQLDRIIRYKKGSISERRQGLVRLRNYLSALRRFDPPMSQARELTSRLCHDPTQAKGAMLKRYEDLLDAYFCTYLALHYWHFGVERNEMIGDVETGYIVVPQRTVGQLNFGEGNSNYINPTRFVVDENRLYEMTTSSFGNFKAILRWMPEDAQEGRSIAWCAIWGREHGLGLQRIDLDTTTELRGFSGMVGEFTLRATAERNDGFDPYPDHVPEPYPLPETVRACDRTSKGTTTLGYVNRNEQEVVSRTESRGSDHGQRVYVLRCRRCGVEYGANGSDIFQRKCPGCQGGKAGEPLAGIAN
ncbi:MAG TPA: DUF429 domain-containing protein [Thermoanaerobaculia bacterium]|nr:DUF429 domain-containing protein [Thermoanaerobaculia bacterium]